MPVPKRTETQRPNWQLCVPAFDDQEFFWYLDLEITRKSFRDRKAVSLQANTRPLSTYRADLAVVSLILASIRELLYMISEILADVFLTLCPLRENENEACGYREESSLPRGIHVPQDLREALAIESFIPPT